MDVFNFLCKREKLILNLNLIQSEDALIVFSDECHFHLIIIILINKLINSLKLIK